MSTPDKPPIHNVTHAFSLEHRDQTDGTHRELHVLVDDQNIIQLIFINKQPGHKTYQSAVALTEIGLDMLYHALAVLNTEMTQHACSDKTH